MVCLTEEVGASIAATQAARETCIDDTSGNHRVTRGASGCALTAPGSLQLPAASRRTAGGVVRGGRRASDLPTRPGADRSHCVGSPLNDHGSPRWWSARVTRTHQSADNGHHTARGIGSSAWPSAVAPRTLVQIQPDTLIENVRAQDAPHGRGRHGVHLSCAAAQDGRRHTSSRAATSRSPVGMVRRGIGQESSLVQFARIEAAARGDACST